MKKKIQSNSAATATADDCESCGERFDRTIYLVGGKEFFKQRQCPTCTEKRSQVALAKENENHRRRIEEAWALFCPPRYRDSSPGQLLAPFTADTIQQVLEWRPSQNGRGLGLVGPARVGKRRLLFLVAKDLFFAGVSLGRISAIEFDRLGSEDEEIRASARRRIERVRSAKVLIFSNIGTEKLTERTQVEFCSLIEHRAQHLLPILWSTQFDSNQLALRFASRQDAELLKGGRSAIDPLGQLKRGRSAIDCLGQCADVIKVEYKSFSAAARSGELLLAQA